MSISGNSAGNFTATATGAVDIFNISTNNGSITVQTSSGTLTLNGNLTAQAGNVNLVNTNTTSGKIVLGAGSSIETNAFSTVPSLGNVSIVIGKLPAPKTNTSPQANIQANTAGTGAIFYGTNGITGIAPVNTVNATNKIVTFSTAKLPATDIQLDGSVNITAIGCTQNGVDGDDVVVDSAADEAGDDAADVRCMLP